MVKMTESQGFTKAKTRLGGRVFDIARQVPFGSPTEPA
jgi:hypothetical protein